MNLKIFITTLTVILFQPITGNMLSSQGEEEEKQRTTFYPLQKTKPEVSLITVFDNFPFKPELKTSWGFSCIIKTPDEVILFDTGGNSKILLSNMQHMNIDPQSISKVVISHIHNDHTGGLDGFLDKNKNVTVFIPASFPESFRSMISGKGAKYENVSGTSAEVSDFIYSTGEVSGPLIEQALIIDSNKGLIIITGCAHPGVINMIKKAREFFTREDIYLVTGGFHNPSPEVVKEFRELGIKKVAPTHCTGVPAIKVFEKEYGVDFIATGTGKIIEIR